VVTSDNGAHGERRKAQGDEMRGAVLSKQFLLGWVFAPMTVFISFLYLVSFVVAGETDPAEDETMLMFVGEELSVVTVASRHPESPLAAPAVVDAVNRSDIERRGFQTLGELLAREPGFYVAQRAGGSVPYLRGIPDGVLFLYDGVPVTSDVTKNFHPLDRELSLNSVKRVEIVRGPSSVLWGPDAFGGVVNVVPLTGRDRPGVEAKAFGGSERLYGGYLGWGLASGEWDMFLSGYGAKDRYHDPDFTVLRSGGPDEEASLGQEEIDDSHYVELTGNAHVGDWLSLSGRYSDFKRRYTLNDVTDLTWAGERETPFNFLKANISKVVGRSHLSLTGYYQYVKYDVSEVTKERDQKNHILNGEFLWDYRLLEKGLLTAGVSYRRNKVEDAVAAENILPPALEPAVPQFLPAVSEENYTNDLKSLFFQYRHRLRDVDLWAGGRVDDHSQYDTTLSHSLGFNWRVLDDWRVKGVYGTAYRSLYSKQLFEGISFDPERISTVSLQLAWDSGTDKSAGLTAFYSSLKDHVSEDPSGVLSKPTDQDILGMELSARTRLSKRLDLFGNVTVLKNWGDPDEYEVKIQFVRPDGTVVEEIKRWEESYDEGPDVIANLGMIWQFHPRASLALEGGMTGKVPFSYVENKYSGLYDQKFLLDGTLRINDVLLKGSTLTFRGTNVLDRDYRIPDLYGPTDSPPFAFYAEWALRF
jgi:outer membrane receptor protein involved in Fe transport